MLKKRLKEQPDPFGANAYLLSCQKKIDITLVGPYNQPANRSSAQTLETGGNSQSSSVQEYQNLPAGTSGDHCRQLHTYCTDVCVKLGNTAASFGGQELKFKNKGKLATDNLTALTNYSEENTDCSVMVI